MQKFIKRYELLYIIYETVTKSERLHISIDDCKILGKAR